MDTILDMLGLGAFKVWIYAALIVGAMAFTGYAVWSYKEATGEIEKQEAVTAANKESQRLLDRQNEQIVIYRDLADSKYGALMDKLSNLKIERTTITNNIRQEIAGNREFYDQPLPLKGWTEWLKARESYNKAATTGATK